MKIYFKNYFLLLSLTLIQMSCSKAGGGAKGTDDNNPSVNTEIMDTFSSNIESKYSYIGVVQNQSGTLNFTFSNNTGTVTNFSIASLPSGFSYQSGNGTCSSINNANPCAISLVYQPTTVDASATTNILPYTYNSNSGAYLTGSLSFQSQGLNRLKWTSPATSTTFIATPSLSPDGLTIYTSNNNAFFYAFNTVDGSLKWQTPDLGSVTQGNPIVSLDNLTVYVGVDDTLYAFHTTAGAWGAAGTQKWSTVLADSTTNFARNNLKLSPDGLVLYAALQNKKLYAFYTTSGAKKWETLANTVLPSHASPTVSPDGLTVYLGGTSGNIKAYNAEDGTERWTHTAAGAEPAVGSVRSSPVLSSDGSKMYFNNNAGIVRALNTSDGSLIWSVAATGASASDYSNPILSSDNLIFYIGSTDNKFYALNTSDGSQKWVATTGGQIQSSPKLSPDGLTVYINSQDSNLYAYNALAGTLKWFTVLGGVAASKSGPVLSSDGSIIYVKSNNNSISAIRENVLKQ